MKKDLYTKEEINQISKAATAIHNKRFGRDFRNGDTGNHRIEREIIGKLGEVAASKYYGGTVDFSLRESGTFTFDSDLDENVHVKTCSYDERYKSNSWTMDRSDPLIIRPDPKDIIVLVYAKLNEDGTGETEVVGHVYAKDIISHYVDCRSPRMKHKCAFYWEDIKKDIVLEKQMS
jgi:hypothetical protein